MSVNDDRGNWRLIDFYSYPEESRMRESWTLMRRLAGESTFPWMILGDFNNILSPDEKRRGATRPNWLYNGFREVVLDYNISDVMLHGHQFMWSRGRNVNNWVEKRLNRAIGNPEWHSRFNSATLNNLIAPILDHNPIMLDTSPVVIDRWLRSFLF